MRTLLSLVVLCGSLFGQFVAPDFKVPAGATMSTYKLVPLGPDLAKHDYDAYMSSIEHLRATFSSGNWPNDKITMADAMKDVEGEMARFQARKSFTYAVLTLDGKKELGCVYISPSRQPGFDAQVRMWVTKAEFDKGFETKLRADMKNWVATAWPFKNVAWPEKAKK
jgi:hypothetical protein